MSNMLVFNRLIVETCIDVVYPKLMDLPNQNVLTVLFCLSSSQYPINKPFVLGLVKFLQRYYNNQIDHTSGESVGKNEYSLRN